MLSRAHEFSSTIFGDSMSAIQLKLEASNAFLLPNEGNLKIVTADKYI